MDGGQSKSAKSSAVELSAERELDFLRKLISGEILAEEGVEVAITVKDPENKLKFAPEKMEKMTRAGRPNLEKLTKVLLEDKKKVVSQPVVAQPLVADLPEVKRLTSEKAESILTRVLIEGDAWRQNDHEYRLNVHHVMRAELMPAYGVKFEGKDLYFSVPFQLTNGRLAILGYIQTDDGVKMRAFYRCQTQGLWRYVPDYVRDTGRLSGIGAFGIGYGDRSLWLPIGLQAVLSQIEAQAGSKKITVANPNFFLAGTVKAYDSLVSYREALTSGRTEGDYYKEVANEAFNHDFKYLGSRKEAPQTLAINAEKAPDFSKMTASFTTHSNMAGEISAEAFLSKDGSYEWLFCRDRKGRVWVAQVEARSELTSLMLRREWLFMGDLMTPIYDYSRRTGGYGDSRDVKGPCQGMWTKYLSKIPLIQEYVKLRG